MALRPVTICNAATTTGAQETQNMLTFELGRARKLTFDAFLSTSTSPSATVLIEVSGDGIHWDTLGTITLSGSGDTASDSSLVIHPYIRANVSAISGTSATVTVIMTVEFGN